MGEADWNFPDGRFLAYILGAIVEGGEPFLIVLNGADEAVDITGPGVARRRALAMHHRHREWAIEFGGA